MLTNNKLNVESVSRAATHTCIFLTIDCLSKIPNSIKEIDNSIAKIVNIIFTRCF